MPKGNKTTVLTLGDQPKLTKFVAQFLKRTCGDSVKTASSGQEALKRCQKKTPDRFPFIEPFYTGAGFVVSENPPG